MGVVDVEAGGAALCGRWLCDGRDAVRRGSGGVYQSAGSGSTLDLVALGTPCRLSTVECRARVRRRPSCHINGGEMGAVRRVLSG
jgi:hypothetical protein